MTLLLTRQNNDQDYLADNTLPDRSYPMKYVTYFLSFFAYVSIHILRMGYSAVKPEFQKQFELDNIFMGVFDGLVYISLATGFFFRFLIEGSTSKTTIYLIFGSLTAVGYLVIPVLGLVLKTSQGNIGDQGTFVRYVVPGLALIMFGFCQFTAWPVLLYLVSQHFSQGTLLGLWSANGDFGNVCGFFLGSLILTDFELDWEYVMIIGAGIQFMMSILVFLILKEKKRGEELLESEELAKVGPVSRAEKFKEFLSFSREIIRGPENKMYLFSFGLLKSVLYGFLLWMPTYLSHKGYKGQSTYAPIVFNACTVAGSALLGFFYGQTKRVPRSEYQSLSRCQKVALYLNKNIKSYSLFYACLIITACLVLFYALPFDMVLIFILSSITGFFLGGTFNMLASNQVVAITKGDESKVDMLATLSMVCGNLFVGMVEIIIGLALNVKDDFSHETNLFIVLLIISSTAALTIFLRSTLLYKLRRKQSILLQNQLDD